MPARSADEATYMLRLEEYKLLRSSAADFTKTQATLIGFGLTAVALVVNRGGKASWIVAGAGLVMLFVVWLFHLVDVVDPRRIRKHLVKLEQDVNQAARSAYGIESTTTLLTWEKKIEAAGGDFLNILRSAGAVGGRRKGPGGSPATHDSAELH